MAPAVRMLVTRERTAVEVDLATAAIHVCSILVSVVCCVVQEYCSVKIDNTVVNVDASATSRMAGRNLAANEVRF